MELLAKSKGALALALIFLIGALAYNAFSGSVMPAAAPSAQEVGADLLKVSDLLSRATLPRELFSTAGYRLLTDFSRALVPEPLGRPNPFAALGQ